jgi:His/Glu/Gln/Arg/opine family amino acid ABC transporter permease subunit
MNRPVLTLLVLIFLISPLHAQTTLDRIRSEGVLRIGTDATFPPLESRVNDRFEGFDIDLGNAMGKELGVKVEWTNSSFDGIFPALLSKKFDLVMSSVTITPERKAKMGFSRPYYNAGQIIAVRRDGEELRLFKELTGKQVGVQINTTAQFALEKQGGVTIKKYNSIDLALTDLKNSRLDAVVSDAPVVRYMVRKGFSELKAVGEPLTEEYYGVVMRQDDGDLQKAVNDALTRIAERGEYARLHKKWFGAEAQMPGVTQTISLRQKEEKAEPLSAQKVMPPLLRGLALTLELTLLSLLGGLPIGLLVALARLSKFKPLAWAAGVYVEFLRGTPLLVQIFAIYYVLPAVGINLPDFTSAVIAFSLNGGAYMAEIFRAGIQSIDKGQMEAAQSLGMSYAMAMRLVVLPQALRRVIPPLTNEGIALLKDTSLAQVVAISELTRSGSELSSRLASPTVIWPIVALLYLVMTFPLTRLTRYLERRWEVGR